MHKVNEVLKATIRAIIVALLFSACLLGIICIIFRNEIKEAMSFMDLISLNRASYKYEEPTLDAETKKIKNYPEYGTKYAQIKIDKIDVDLPVYFGDDMETLKKGVGHSSRKLFPR